MRTWWRGAVYEPDPDYEVLLPCRDCGRKVGTGPLKGLRIWTVRRVVHGWGPHPRPSWNLANVTCADSAECRAYIAAKERSRRQAAERRSPRLPNERGPGCNWCGYPIVLTDDAPHQSRQRTLHRGDRFEVTDHDCVRPANVWRDPPSALHRLVDAQDGRCAICNVQIAERTEDRSWVEFPDGRWIVRGIVAVDHIVPLADGGENYEENLQVICQKPCHREKTAREARDRAKRRKLAA